MNCSLLFPRILTEHAPFLKKNGSSGRTRTYNPPVNSRQCCTSVIFHGTP
jgi:hypothetical protein